MPPASHADLGNRTLVVMTATSLAVCVAFLLGLPALPEAARRPGSPLLHGAAVLGSLLLLVSFAAVFAKRVGRPGKRAFHVHVRLALAGLPLVVAHTTGSLLEFPALLLAAIAGLAGLGVWARTAGARRMTATFGTKRAGFAAPDPALRARLAAIVARKRALLARLDAGADEALFSVTLAHWLRAPLQARAYRRAAREESRLLGARASVGAAQAWWRVAHQALAWAFVGGLLVHAALATFFAGYVAEGREIYWWHVTAWDF